MKPSIEIQIQDTSKSYPPGITPGEILRDNRVDNGCDVLAAALKFIPNRRVDARAAFAGGVLCAALWEGAKRLFAWYVGSVAQHNVIYGSLGTLVVVPSAVVWADLVKRSLYAAIWRRREEEAVSSFLGVLIHALVVGPIALYLFAKVGWLHFSIVAVLGAIMIAASVTAGR